MDERTASTPRMSPIISAVFSEYSGLTIAPLSLTRMLFPAALSLSSSLTHLIFSEIAAISPSSARPETIAPLEFIATSEPTTNEPPTETLITSTPSADSRVLMNPGSASAAVRARPSPAVANTAMFGFPE